MLHQDDLTGGERPNIYASAVKKLNLLRPEFVMSVGDLVVGSGVDSEGEVRGPRLRRIG